MQIFEQDPSKKKTLSPVFVRLRHSISNSYALLAWQSYVLGKDIRQIIALCETALNFDNRNAMALTNYALFLFKAGDKPEAQKAIKRIKRINIKNSVQDNSWLYSEAFLFFDDGDYSKGITSYQKAFKGVISPLSYASVIQFLNDYLITFPGKAQFHFALGWIFIKGGDNYTQALQPLEDFASYDPQVNYPDLYQIWVNLLKETYDALDMPTEKRITP